MSHLLYFYVPWIRHSPWIRNERVKKIERQIKSELVFFVVWVFVGANVSDIARQRMCVIERESVWVYIWEKESTCKRERGRERELAQK